MSLTNGPKIGDPPTPISDLQRPDVVRELAAALDRLAAAEKALEEIKSECPAATLFPGADPPLLVVALAKFEEVQRIARAALANLGGRA